MKIFRGPFHPHLENALIEEIQHFKSDNPLKPLLIVVPSDTLKQYLAKRFTLGHQLNLMNLTLLNFNQLSRIICEETPGHRNFILNDAHFFEEVLRRHLIPTSHSDKTLAAFTRSEGGISALSQTIRDLKEGLISPDVVEQALNEGHFGQGARRGHLPRLIKQYRDLKTLWKKHKLMDYGDLVLQATESTPDSNFLKHFSGIFYYGFYDLTQILIDFLHTLTQHTPATLFFPSLKNQPGWIFAEQFFERYIEGLAAGTDAVIDLPKQSEIQTPLSARLLFGETETNPPKPSQITPDATVINCFDREAEVFTMAKEILRLCETKGFKFHEIGVVSRDINLYLPHITSCFQKHAVPMSSACNTPLIRYPRARAVLQLSELLAENFPRTLCIDLITAPFFKTTLFCNDALQADRNLWDLISRKKGVKKGIASWQRLTEAPKTGETHFDTQTGLLWTIISSLHTLLNDLPLESSWSDFALRWETLLINLLDFETLKEEDDDENNEQHTLDSQFNKTVLTRLHRLAKLDVLVGKPVSRQDFIQAFQRGIRQASFPISNPDTSGVQVMDVMQARGMAFPVLFVLGVNEGVFPRSIREDPLLLDLQRRVLETVLGYKVGEKLAGYQEEKLLFIMTVCSARDKLYIFYHRSDDLGHPVAPSGYLNEFKKIHRGQDPVDFERKIPQRLIERHQHPPFNEIRYTLLEEQAIYNHLLGQSSHALLKELPFSSSLYFRGMKALTALESTGPLSPYDGIIPDKTHWADIEAKGISPTRIENYAKCPFQYFASKLLNLARMDTPEDETETGVSDIGTLCHDILNDVYKTLVQTERFNTLSNKTEVYPILSQIAMEHFARYESISPPHYPVQWDTLKAQLILVLDAVITADLAALIKNGFRPAAFEVNVRQKIEHQWPEFFGRIDRIDFNPETGKIRVVDYKLTFRKSPRTGEKNLLRLALRGEKLQAPIYLRLAGEFSEEWETQDDSQCTSVFYHIAPNWPDGPLVISEFPETGWQGPCGDQLKTTISNLFKGLSSGRFFMKPGEYCQYCDVRTLCRQHHLPSLQRIENDVSWQNHYALQDIKIPKNNEKIQAKPE